MPRLPLPKSLSAAAAPKSSVVAIPRGAVLVVSGEKIRRGCRVVAEENGAMVGVFGFPIVVAPMAGGPSTPGLVTAAAAAGALGFLAAGYKAPDLVAREVAELRASRVPFGLNIFVPSPPPIDVAPVQEYRQALQPEAQRYGVELPQLRLDDDDGFAAKVQVAVGAPCRGSASPSGFRRRRSSRSCGGPGARWC